MAQKYLRSELG